MIYSFVIIAITNENIFIEIVVNKSVYFVLVSNMQAHKREGVVKHKVGILLLFFCP